MKASCGKGLHKREFPCDRGRLVKKNDQEGERAREPVRCHPPKIVLKTQYLCAVV